MLPVARRARANDHAGMSTKRNTTIAAWGTTLVRGLAYSPWVTFMIVPVTTLRVRNTRSDA